MFAGLAEDNPGLSPLSGSRRSSPPTRQARKREECWRSRATRRFECPHSGWPTRTAGTRNLGVPLSITPTPLLKAARVGAAHATELPYVFGNFGTLNPDPTFWLGGRRGAIEVSGRITTSLARLRPPRCPRRARRLQALGAVQRGEPVDTPDRRARQPRRGPGPCDAGGVGRRGDGVQLADCGASKRFQLRTSSTGRRDAGLKSVPSVYATGKSPTCVAVRDSEQIRHPALAEQVHGRPCRAEPAGPQREHETPPRGDHGAPPAACMKTSMPRASSFSTGWRGWDLVQMFAEVFDGRPDPTGLGGSGLRMFVRPIARRPDPRGTDRRPARAPQDRRRSPSATVGDWIRWVPAGPAGGTRRSPHAARGGRSRGACGPCGWW